MPRTRGKCLSASTTFRQRGQLCSVGEGARGLGIAISHWDAPPVFLFSRPRVLFCISAALVSQSPGSQEGAGGNHFWNWLGIIFLYAT